jgi:tyramine---L-glutamate ligase
MTRMAGPVSDRSIFLFEFVTGGGLAGNDLPASWASEGHAMRRALVRDFSSIPGVRVFMTFDARFQNECGDWETIRVDQDNEAKQFDALASRSDYAVIIAPETDLHLLDRSEHVERLGGRLISCSPEGIRLAGSKYELGRLLESASISTPPTFWRGQEDRLSDDLRLHFYRAGDSVPRMGMHPLPAVLKSNHGAGSMHTFKIDDFDSIPQGADGDILQPFMSGEPRSASFLIGGDCRAHLVGIGRQRMRTQEGRFHYDGGIVPIGPPECHPSLIRAIELLDRPRGWIGVDFLWDEATGGTTILEINPRVTTSYVGLRALLPPGELARVWLELVDDPSGGAADDLARRVHTQPPVRFDADGTVSPERGAT